MHDGQGFVLPLLGQELVLELQPRLKFRLLAPALGVRGLLFQHEAGVLSVLLDDDREHAQHDERGEHALDQAAGDDALGNDVDLIAYDALADQVGEHPVGARHGEIVQRLVDAAVVEGDDALLPRGEVARGLVIGGAVLEPGVLEGVQQVHVAGRAAEHDVGQRDAAAVVEIAEGGLVGVGLQGQALQQHVHVDLHEAGHQHLAIEGQAVDGQRDDDLLVFALDVLDGHLRAGDGHVVEAVVRDVIKRPKGGVDQAVGVHEGELLRVVELLHLGLERLQMLQIGQIVLIQQVQRVPHVLDVVLQVGGDDLPPAPGQLPEVEVAHGAHGPARGALGADPGPDRRQYQYERDQ